jgi:hypothetical protein
MMRSDLVVSLVAGVFLILLVLLPYWLWRRRQSSPRDLKTDPHETRPETICWLHPKARMRPVWPGIHASLTGAWRPATSDDIHPRASTPR